MNDASADAAVPVITADPTMFIALCWILSAAFLGGLIVHAIIEARRS